MCLALDVLRDPRVRHRYRRERRLQRRDLGLVPTPLDKRSIIYLFPIPSHPSDSPIGLVQVALRLQGRRPSSLAAFLALPKLPLKPLDGRPKAFGITFLASAEGALLPDHLRVPFRRFGALGGERGVQWRDHRCEWGEGVSSEVVGCEWREREEEERSKNSVGGCRRSGCREFRSNRGLGCDGCSATASQRATVFVFLLGFHWSSIYEAPPCFYCSCAQGSAAKRVPNFASFSRPLRNFPLHTFRP